MADVEGFQFQVSDVHLIAFFNWVLQLVESYQNVLFVTFD